MKTVSIIIKIVAALAVVAGIVYVVITYGDKIVSWAKKLLNRCGCSRDECDCEGREECCSECDGCERKEAVLEVEENDFENQ